MCSGKGQWLARQIQSLQKEHVGVNTSEYFSDDESDESFHTSLDSSVFFTLEDMESDGKSPGFYCFVFLFLFIRIISNDFIVDSACD